MTLISLTLGCFTATIWCLYVQLILCSTLTPVALLDFAFFSLHQETTLCDSWCLFVCKISKITWKDVKGFWRNFLQTLIAGQGIDNYNFDVFLDSRDFHLITAMDAMTHIFPFPLPIPEFRYLQKRALFALILSLLIILYEAVIYTYVWMHVPKGIMTLIWDQKRSQKNRSHVNNKIIPCALSLTLFFSNVWLH